MPLVIREVVQNGVSRDVPMLLCEVCGARIVRYDDGNAVFTGTGDQLTQGAVLVFVHKACDEQCRNQLFDIGLNAWHPLEEVLMWLLNGLQFDAEAQQTLKQWMVGEPTKSRVTKSVLRKFAKLVALEPQLEALRAEALQVADPGGPHFCANGVWYDRFKPRMQTLVGWDRPAGPPELQSHVAYSTAYSVIYEAIPVGCRNCGCFG